MAERTYTAKETSRNPKLEACVHLISTSKDLPAFAHDIYELMTTVADKEASLSRLTNIILRNVSLTAKLLRLVNSAYFNRSGRQILSVSVAVTLLGWNTIRDLASGLMLFDKFEKQSSSAKEMVLASLLTANQARELSVHVRYPRVEEAYLCGMFGCLGELLIAFNLPKEYAQINGLVDSERVSVWEACLRVLGFTYEDLGKAMVKEWKLPERISGGMTYVEHFSSGRTTNETDQLHLITAFSRALTSAVYREETGQRGERVQYLLKRFGSALSLNPENVDLMLKAALKETREIYAIARVPLETEKLEKNLGEATAPLLPSSPQEQAAEPEVSLEEQVAQQQENNFFDLSKEVDVVIESAEDYPLNDLIMMILEAVYRGLGCDRVLFCLLEQDRAYVRGRMGIGEGAEELLADFRFPVSLLSGPIGAALVGKRDIYVEDAPTSRYSQTQFTTMVAAKGFAICPMIIGGIVVGCFYLDCLEKPLAVTDKSKEILSKLRDHAATIIAKKSRQQ